MFDKCIKCESIGERCVPNLWLLPFPELIKWCDKKQKYLGWSNQKLADESKVPIGTINRIKSGDYADCKFSTIRGMLIALIGGTTDEFACTEQVEKELQQMEQLEKQAAKLTETEAECKILKAHLSKIDEQHRADIRIIKNEYQEEINFLKEELKAWRNLHQSHS